MNHALIADLKKCFSDHGKPILKEDPEWVLLVHTQVLMMEILENIMSTIQNLADNAKTEAAALVDLNNTVVAMSPPSSGGTTGTGGTSISAADQTLLDTANDTITSNIAKIGEIKTALSQPAVTPPTDGGPVTAPLPGGQPAALGSSAVQTPIVPPAGGPPQS